MVGASDKCNMPGGSRPLPQTAEASEHPGLAAPARPNRTRRRNRIVINTFGSYGCRRTQADSPSVPCCCFDADPVVQIVDESGGEVVHTLRIRGTRFLPQVFREGKYAICLGRPDEDRLKTFPGLSATVDNQEVINVSF